MVQRGYVEECVVKALEALNESLPDDKKISVGTRTPLFGKSAKIDSLSLVSLIVEIETTLSSELGTELSLTDDRAMTRKQSPFETVQTLVDYIIEVVGNNSSS